MKIMNVNSYNCFVEDVLKCMPPEDRKKWEDMIFAADRAKEDVPEKWVVGILLGVGEHACKHWKTTICYRENYAAGDVVCWKEFCRECGKFTGRGGIKRYDHSKDEGRDVIEHKDTIFDEGYFFCYDTHG